MNEKELYTGYRRLAEQTGNAPTGKTSDQEIVEIHKKVSTAFIEAAAQRGEAIPESVLNFIAWKFMLVNEMLGPELVEQHLSYEIEKYMREGLRPDYQQDLIIP